MGYLGERQYIKYWDGMGWDLRGNNKGFYFWGGRFGGGGRGMGGFDGWLGWVVWCSMDAGLVVVVVVVYLLHIFTYLPTYPYLIPRGIFLFCFFRWAHITPLPYLQYLSTLYSHRL